MEKRFNIEFYQDGRPTRFGNEYGLNSNDTANNLLSYDCVKDDYSKEKLLQILEALTSYTHFGNQWFEIKVTPIKQ